MKKYLLLIPCLVAIWGSAAPVDYGFDQEERELELVIHNRVLLKVQGKPVTVMDITRKMDILFYRQYPDLADSSVGRYQFYKASWKVILSSVIDDLLTLADAEEKKVSVTDGDVREELESLFGPDVVLNIDRLGLTYDEAWDLLKTELTVKRMTGAMVQPKALSEVNPMVTRKAYEEYLKKNPPEETWCYQVFSIRGDEEKRNTLAILAQQLLDEENIAFADLAEHLQTEEIMDGDVKISLSEEYTRTNKELSLAHKGVLQALQMGEHSGSLAQKGEVTRLFFLKSHDEGTKLSYNELAPQLEAQLTSEGIGRHTEAYRKKLREQYGITESYLNRMIPADFVPFSLR